MSVWTVFVAFACLYGLSIGGGFGSSDGEVMFQTTAALVEHGSFALAPDAGLPQIIPGENHAESGTAYQGIYPSTYPSAYYSKYDPGLPLLAVPFYVAGDWIGAVNRAHRTQLAAIAVLFLPALAAAGTVALVYGLAREMAGTRRGLFAALAAGLATTLWPYARMLFAESVLALTLTGAVAVIGWTRGRRGGWYRAGWLALAGAIFGVGVATRAASGVYALPLAWLILAVEREDGRGLGWHDHVVRLVVRLGAFGAGVLPAIGLLLAHNALRFGDPWMFGYAEEGFTTPLWRGALGLVLSPGKGALIVAPPLILSAILWPRWRREAPALAGFVALAWAVALVFYGRWWAWGGGWCWGPRFVVPLLPLSCVSLAWLPNRLRWRWAAEALLVLGMALQVVGVLGDVTPLYARVAAAHGGEIGRVSWALSDAPWVFAAEPVVRGEIAPRAVFRLAESGLPVTWSVGLPLVLVVGLVGGVMWGVMRGVVKGCETCAVSRSAPGPGALDPVDVALGG